MRGCLYFAVLLAIGTSAAVAKDITLFVDRSISMKKRFAAAIEGAKLFVQLADDKSSIRIVAFYGEADPSPRFEFSQPSARARALAWLDKLEPDGSGTDFQSALAAIENEPKTVGIFISDGEHEGTEKSLLEHVDRLSRRLVLHTVAIDAPVGSEADVALAKMASRTGGSHVRVESSEELLQQLLRLAVRNGNYRGYAPKNRLVALGQVSGRVMAFGLDGRVAVTPSNLVRREHTARLPGENIHLAVIEPPRPTDVRLVLAGGRTRRARLGTIFVDDLPTHRLIVRNQQADYAPGSKLQLSVTFYDRRDRQIARLPSGVQGEFTLVSADRKVLSNRRSRTTKGQIDAVISLPAEEGIYNLRVTSLWPRQGKAFLQTTEHSLVVKKPSLVALDLSPKRIDGVVPSVRFERSLSVKNTAVDSAGSIDARVAGSDMIAIEDSRLSNGKIVLGFRATQPGKFKGKVSVRIPLGDQLGVGEVPFSFDVQTPFKEHRAEEVEITTKARTPVFSTPTKSIKVAAAADEIARFKVLISPTDKHSGSSSLTADFQMFDQAGKPVKEIVATAKWAKSVNTIRGLKGSATLEGTILSPLTTGTYTSKLVIRASTGYSITIPITLDVR